MPRAELAIDGNAGFALVGEDIQSGNAEFETINGYTGGPMNAEQYKEAKKAINRAFQRLKARYKGELSYYIGPSHPDHC